MGDLNALKAQLGNGGFEDADPSADADAGLKEPIEGGEDPTPEPTGDDDPEAGNDDPEAAAAALEQQKQEESEYLKGEKLVKTESGEWVSKKSFLKRMKEQSERRKEYEAKLLGYKKFDDQKDHYEHWDKNHEQYKRSVETVDSLNRVLQAEPWLLPILQARAAGKPVNWQELTPVLKPFLTPFWDGTELREEDPLEKVVGPLKQQLETLQQAEKKREQETQQRQKQAREQELIRADQAKFAEQEKVVWGKWKKYFDPAAKGASALWRNRLLDHAAAIQDTMPEGQLVNLAEVAEKFFGEEEAFQKQNAAEREKQRKKSRLAGGEGGGRLPGSPAPKDDPNAAKLPPMKALGQKLAAQFGPNFE